MESSAAPTEGVGEHGREHCLTKTQEEQLRVERSVFHIFQVLCGATPQTQSLVLELWRDQHIEYLEKGLEQLGPSFCVLDASRPWLCYWIIHALSLLGKTLDDERESDVVDFLSCCQDQSGGYSGGPQQMPHLATTYAAVNTLVSLRSEHALSSINRGNLYKFLLQMKDASGGFRMHDDGEIDIRACYTAISVASLLNILDDELAKGVGKYIASCQTYEGGIAGEPCSEAHGGYTFCGLAAMILINETERLDLPSLIAWVAFRQGIEGGFQGRTNKLVDGCYSFWQGGALALTQRLLAVIDEQLKSYATGVQQSPHNATSEMGSSDFHEQEPQKHKTLPRHYSKIGYEFAERGNQIGPLYHSIALQQYIILCSQVLEGGLKDKPGKGRDHYHSCYCLSGLSVSQHSWTNNIDDCPADKDVLGPYSNLLEPLHPLYNVLLERFYAAYNFFSEAAAA